MKKLRLVDSLNKVSQVKHIEACNWYMGFKNIKEKLDKDWKREHNYNNIKKITIVHHA